ncbi:MULTISPECIES: hypothetical protein [unclassified Paraflavitalea]|uniref:hypothetical protein n=1 Tax=unclassified Paraflavitalea TaxID=2798305 RepID=UPI003D342165
MRLYLIALAGFLAFQSCSVSPVKNDDTVAADTTAAAKEESEPSPYFPVLDLLKSDVIKVDSFAAGIMSKRIYDGKKDSTFINIDSFKNLTKQFIIPELDFNYFQEHFTEKSIMETSTDQLTVIYTPKENIGTIKQVTVYISQTASGNKVDMLYIDKVINDASGSSNEKLLWKTGHYFTITKDIIDANKKSHQEIRHIIWDPEYFNRL